MVSGEGERWDHSLDYEGVTRIWHVYLPAGFKKEKAAPLVIALHGGGGNGRKFDEMSTQGTLSAAADRHGVVLAFPQGIKKQWHDGREEILKSDRVYDDVGFISQLIDSMISRYGIDSTRVYATGISNGGFMSVRLAMDLSHRIAAIAPVTAQISRALAEKRPAHPVSVMIINGTDDPLVPYDGGEIRLFRFGRSRGEILSTNASIEIFRDHNGCSDAVEKSSLPDVDPDDGTRVEIEKYAGCDKNIEVMLVRVIGGGHTWPGGKQYLGPRLVGTVSRDINASEMILDFFLRHKLSL